MKDLKNIIFEAEKKKVAIGHFNISNLEQLKAVYRTALKLNLPVIIGVSEGEREYVGVREVAALVKSYNENYAKGNFYLFLNADHTHSLDKVKEAAEAGYDMVVFDGSKLPVDENIKATKEAVKIAKKISASRRKEILVEGELGYIGSGSEVRKELPKDAAVRREDFTNPEEAERFVKETGVELLAPAVGNIHGMFADAPNPDLDIDRIREIREKAGVPLVLHGGSGIKDKDFVAAIDAGISMIHISTELRVAWRRGLEEAFKDNPDEVAPYKLMPEVLQEMGEVVENRISLFNKLTRQN